jgi:NAD(P)-dependent dehydrogenase (short-subunit alcohol dehydrogenase family)
MNISGKTAVVTGGASGLGLATVKRLLEAGAGVAVLDLNAIQDDAIENDYINAETIRIDGGIRMPPR